MSGEGCNAVKTPAFPMRAPASKIQGQIRAQKDGRLRQGKVLVNFSQACVDLVKQFEGKGPNPERGDRWLCPYPCPAGKLTVG